jgi:hypothetical protein
LTSTNPELSNGAFISAFGSWEASQIFPTILGITLSKMLVHFWSLTVTTPILVFPYWENTFHVHVYASPITLGSILAQPGEEDLDHPIAFASRNLLESEQNYNTT